MIRSAWPSLVVRKMDDRGRFEVVGLDCGADLFFVTVSDVRLILVRYNPRRNPKAKM